MAQFDIFENTDQRTKSRVPFIMDIQSDQVSVLSTRIVVPLHAKSERPGQPLTKLHPVVLIGNVEYIALVTELAAIKKTMLGSFVASAIEARQDIVSACDLLLTGF